MNGTQLSAWLTLAVAAFTGWMAWETRRMAKAALGSVAAAAKPELAFTNLELKQAMSIDPNGGPDFLGVQVKLLFDNPGRVRVNYDLERVDVELRGKSAPIGFYDNHRGIIAPRGSAGFYLSAARLDSALELKDMMLLRLRVRFWASPQTRELLTFALRVVIIGRAPLQWHWVFTDGPTYA
jgi:hypothetical protein